MQEAESQLQPSPSQALTQETPPQDRHSLGSVVLSQRPDILPLPEHLHNRKQRNDSLVAEFQLSLEGAGWGRWRRQDVPGGSIFDMNIYLKDIYICAHHARSEAC